MSVTAEMVQLGQASRRLNDGSDEINRSLARIDQLLGQMMIGMEYVLPRPISEVVAMDSEQKRVIELSFLAYMRIRGSFHLAIKTVKVLESKKAVAEEQAGTITPLLEAHRRVRHAAVDLLPLMVSSLARQVDEVVGQVERRCSLARGLVTELEAMLEVENPGPARSTPVGY